MIEVRIKFSLDLMQGGVDKKLTEAGIPSLPRRDGGLMQWFDVKTDEFVFEYYPMEEMRARVAADLGFDNKPEGK